MVATRKTDNAVSTGFQGDAALEEVQGKVIPRGRNKPLSGASTKDSTHLDTTDNTMRTVVGKVIPATSSKTISASNTRIDVSVEDIMGAGGLRPSVENEVQDIIRMISSLKRGSPEIMILKEGRFRRLKSHNCRYILDKIKKGGSVYNASQGKIYGSRILGEEDRAVLKERNIEAKEVTLNKKEWKIVAKTLAIVFHETSEDEENKNEHISEESKTSAKRHVKEFKEEQTEKEHSKEKAASRPDYKKAHKRSEERLLGVAREQGKKELYRKQRRELYAQEKREVVQHSEVHKEEKKKQNREKEHKK